MGGLLALVVATVLSTMLVIFAIGAIGEFRGKATVSWIRVTGCGCSVLLVLLGLGSIIVILAFSHFGAMGGASEREANMTAALYILFGVVTISVGMALAYWSLRRSRLR